MNQSGVQQAAGEEQVAQGEVAELRQVVERQTEQLEALAAKVDALLSREGASSSVHSGVRDQLLQRDDQVQALLYDLQLAATKQQGDPRAIDYQQLIGRIRELVRIRLPREARVVVVSKGDDKLLSLYGRPAWHFPLTREGSYPGHYPHSSSVAIVQLEALRAKGGEFLLFPSTAFWWLDHYADFKRHLERRYRVLVREEDTCLIYSLREPSMAGDATPYAELEELVTEYQTRYESAPAILDWNTGLDLASALPQHTVFSPPGHNGALPYLDHSIDLIAVASPDSTFAEEAHRVARAGVVIFTPTRTGEELKPRLEVQWKLEEGAVAKLPSASIIIPTYNGVEHIDTCLAALQETLPPDFRGQVIVVDDATTDETRASLGRWSELDPRIHVLRNAENSGFIASCNRGARAATGDILVFLNNDTVPLPGWLPALLRTFRDYEDAGAVGGMLLFPDGTLQEAGGVIFSDGSGANFGRDSYDIDAPLFNYVREVDYCSGALLATRRALFFKLGEFSTEYGPAYYEDTDYCFKMRENGYRVYYQPESKIIHFEGGTSGTDLSVGVKRYQMINHAKFLKRWSHVLNEHPRRPRKWDFSTWHALAARGGEGAS